MSKVTVNEQSLIDIAEAIREKNKTENTYRPSEMAAAVLNLPTSIPVIEDIEIVANGVYEPAEGIDGFNKVTVEVPANVTSIEITANGTYEATDVDGYNVITVNTPTLSDEDLVVTGNCEYRFASNGWNWLIEKYGDRITTVDIIQGKNMFTGSKTLTEIPFELNFYSVKDGLGSNNLEYIFNDCNALLAVPKINNCKPISMNHIFSGCYSIREIPEDIASWFDWSQIDPITSAYSASRACTFNNCYSLRYFPMNFLAHGNPVVAYSYSIYYSLFNSCCVLDEVVDLPNPHINATWTSNAFSNTFYRCVRLKKLTFATPDGQPYVVNWKNQTIDLSSRVGYDDDVHTMITDRQKELYFNNCMVLVYNSGITNDKCIYDDATYQALKDDPDCWAVFSKYSRYNHDSAVETINSLPDTSAYLATAGGTNTIKFKGAAGSLTDGGAINTLTEAEIAVATAKGWTVTFA